jgi:hypothetical protein
LISASRRRRVADFGTRSWCSRSLCTARIQHQHRGLDPARCGDRRPADRDRGLRDRQPEELDNRRECPQQVLGDRNASRSNGTGAAPDQPDVSPAGCTVARWASPNRRPARFAVKGRCARSTSGISSPRAVRANVRVRPRGQRRTAPDRRRRWAGRGAPPVGGGRDAHRSRGLTVSACLPGDHKLAALGA